MGLGYRKLDVHHRMMAQPARMSHQYAAKPQSAGVARERLLLYLSNFELSEEQRFAILYAAGEALANAIEHGSARPHDRFFFTVDCEEDKLLIHIESHGHWRAFEPNEERGRGIPIMEALADRVDIVTDREGTIVQLSFRL